MEYIIKSWNYKLKKCFKESQKFNLKKYKLLFNRKRNREDYNREDLKMNF